MNTHLESLQEYDTPPRHDWAEAVSIFISGASKNKLALNRETIPILNINKVLEVLLIIIEQKCVYSPYSVTIG